MNVYDANRMGDALLARGYTESSELSQADLVILNTCHIREKATEKVFSELGRLKDLREQRALIGEKLGIVVAGCVAQAEGKEILRRQPAVDLVIGSQNYHRLPDLLVKAEAFPNQVDTDFPIEDKFDHLPMPTPSRVALRGVSAFVTVQEPCDMQDDLIYAHRDVPQLMPNVHLPAQSGSDRVLKAMNRNHTRADYLATLERIRRVNPEIAFTSDFIVGFPGETDDEFAETLSLVEAVDYSDAFCFMYSPRAGTGAAALADHVPDGVKRDRLSRLQALIQTQRAKFVSGVIGQKLEVLFEKKGRYDGQIIGKSPLMHNVHVEGPVSLIGMAVDVEIIAFGQNSLRGRIVRSTLGSRGESTV
jgi:tRNA A37 methylthiotransferase MiaB